MKAGLTFEDMREMVGQEVGVSGWMTIDQDKINQFAECTEDRQWIHIDAARAKRESPFRVPIAHGYLTLSLITVFAVEIGMLPENTQAAFNYGLDRVRFVAPVRVGSRVRMRTTLAAMEDKGPGQYLVTTSNTIEIEGDSRPALMAEALVMFYERRKKRQG